MACGAKEKAIERANLQVEKWRARKRDRWSWAAFAPGVILQGRLSFVVGARQGQS